MERLKVYQSANELNQNDLIEKTTFECVINFYEEKEITAGNIAANTKPQLWVNLYQAHFSKKFKIIGFFFPQQWIANKDINFQ